jgi:3-oxoacyl-[acyl-carrier protein] reductase/meso-butanediol dehydrogenase/(S,S)-butanediol dehydrogenase/diacetyl reductase
MANTATKSPVAVIAGYSKGIGYVLAKEFMNAGYQVIGLSRTAPHVPIDGVKHVAIDMTDEQKVRALTVELTAEFEIIDVWVNNVGLSAWKPLEEIDVKFWRQMMDVNLTTTMLGSQAAAALMGKGGSIINMSSLAGKRGSANNGAYCAAKFGVNGLTQALAKELGGKAIRVNAVCPVYIKTDGLLEALNDPQSPTAAQPFDTYIENFSKANAALGRMPEATEVAATCLFLASTQAAAITGQCINVDCGVMPQ